MISDRKLQRSRSRSGLAVAAILTAGILAGCDSLLDVELPGSISEESLYEPSSASLLVTSAIANIECGYSDFVATNSAGNEDVMRRVTGWWRGTAEYDSNPSLSNCNTGETSYGWWTPLQKGRFLAEGAYERITEWDVDNKDRLLAQAALYAAIPYDVFGSYFCEVSFEEGPLLSPDQTLEQADEWLSTSLSHLGSSGDFELPAGIASSTQQFAYALRARVRWGLGDNAGALADAAQVQQGFVAYATRDAGGERSRWNKIFNSHNEFGINTVIGPIDNWTGSGWPAVIPYTGYRNLAVLPNGRAVTDDRYPITLADAGAVADPRVPVVDTGSSTNGIPRWLQQKYPDTGADVAIVQWEEIWLIRAELEGGATAVQLVNEIRSAYGLPLVTYTDGSDPELVKEMIIEERRRSLFLEGRFWATKLREDLWFPRAVGSTINGDSYQNGIRMVMQDSEYEINPNFDLTARGTLCGDQAPA